MKKYELLIDYFRDAFNYMTSLNEHMISYISTDRDIQTISLYVEEEPSTIRNRGRSWIIWSISLGKDDKYVDIDIRDIKTEGLPHHIRDIEGPIERSIELLKQLLSKLFKKINVRYKVHNIFHDNIIETRYSDNFLEELENMKKDHPKSSELFRMVTL